LGFVFRGFRHDIPIVIGVIPVERSLSVLKAKNEKKMKQKI